MFATKYSKSLIEQELEKRIIKEEFNDSMKRIVENYSVTDSIFNASGELTEGYFEYVYDFDTLEEALDEMEECGVDCLRIVNENLYQIGVVHEKLSACSSIKGAHVYDIEKYKEIV